MRSPVFVALLFVGCLGSVGPAADLPATQPNDVPRYSLPVGRALTYQDTSNVRFDGGGSDSSATIEITVARQNVDGSRHIITRTTRRTDQFRGEASTQPSAWPERVTFSWVDMFPDGEVMASDDKAGSAGPPILPPLPSDVSGLHPSCALLGETMKYSLTPLSNGDRTYQGSSDGVFGQIYGRTRDQTMHFDSAKGIMTTIEGHNTQDYPAHAKGSGTIRLVSDKIIPPEQAAALADQVDRYFKVRDGYNAQMDSIEDSPDKAETISAAARQMIVDALAAEKSPDIRPLLQSMLDDHDGYNKFEMESIQNRAAVLNKPLPDFTVTDIDGQSHSLADCRGKVILMDFWYRGCGWCMVAMPQIKQVKDDFSGKAVVVLGMNTDTDPADAKFVSDALKLNYPTCKATNDFASKLGVRAFPSLILVDKDGIVRRFDEGYTPTLRQDLGRKIQGLLDAPTTRK